MSDDYLGEEFVEYPGGATCYMCGQPFSPTEEQVKEWGDSGRPFDPTDWVCDECREIKASCPIDCDEGCSDCVLMDILPF